MATRWEEACTTSPHMAMRRIAFSTVIVNRQTIFLALVCCAWLRKEQRFFILVYMKISTLQWRG